MSPTTSLKNASAPEDHQLDTIPQSNSWLAKIHPYFKDPQHVFILKLDAFLLSWAFVAGVSHATHNAAFPSQLITIL